MLNTVSIIIIPLLITITLVIALKQKRNPYNKFVDGAKDGLKLFYEIFPTFLAMITAVELLRTSGVFFDLASRLDQYIPNIKVFTELMPQVLFRPLSGGASLSVMTSICSTNGPDSFLCQVSSVIQGSTDTTFYVISLYFTSIGVTKWRHALKAGLTADFIGIVLALVLSFIFLN